MWKSPWISDQQTVIQQNLVQPWFHSNKLFPSAFSPLCQALTLWNVKSQALLTTATRFRTTAILPAHLFYTAVILVTRCMAAVHWPAWAEIDVFGTNHCHHASVSLLQHLITCGGVLTSMNSFVPFYMKEFVNNLWLLILLLTISLTVVS